MDLHIKQVRTILIDALIVAFCVAWFILPVTFGADVPLAPWNMAIKYLWLAGLSPASIALFSVYLVPLFAAFVAVSVFIGDRMGKFGQEGDTAQSILRIAISSIMVYATILPILTFADRATWFTRIPLSAWILFPLAFGFNVASVVFYLKRRNFRNPVYREYSDFRRDQKKNLPAIRGRSRKSSLEILFKIRTKLFLAFIGIISVILLFLSTLLLGNYRTSIIKAVGDGAKSQVLQASSTYRINLGDPVAMFEYVMRQIDLNRTAEFKYNQLTIYTNLKKEVYLDDLPTEMPDYLAEFSTHDPGVQFPSIDPMKGNKAHELAALFGTSHAALMQYNKPSRTYEYCSPIIKINTTRKDGEKLRRERVLGFSVMTFDEDVIMKPYFMTRVSVIVYTLFFLYIAIILTYIVGNYIVNPLLFLKMNVHKISDVLSMMIRGTERVSSNSLVYNDCVTSRDEIKSLSTEINDMVTVIRGIVPYISASTLKHAEKGEASTTQKELAFLFTDIRGFTTLCEGLEPDQVVAILNRYLDLETEIILNNHGDVDKFVGDEMMAFFEGPNKEENACRAAMQIRHAMMEEKERREAAGQPVVSIGIGINTGNVVFGSVGARDRMDFTSIGDTVNLAARLEGANKAYGSKSIITEAVYTKVQEHFLCRELDFIAVKGKTEPVRIYEILQAIPQAHPKLVKIKETFETGLKAYRKRSWKTAASAFERNIKEFNDNPSKVYLERIEHFSKNPPPDDWDGVFRMTVK